MKKIFFRSFYLIIILGAFIYYIVKNSHTIEKTVQVTLSQSIGYIFLAALFCGLAYLFMVLMNKKVFDMMGVRRKTWEMALLQMSSLAINVVIPSGGISVGLMFANDAKDRKESGAAAVTAVIIALLTDYTSIAFLLIIAMIYLATIGSLGLPVIVPAIAFLCLTVGLFALIILAGRNKKILKKILNWAEGVWNKVVSLFKKNSKGGGAAIDNFVVELENAYIAINNDRASIYKALSYILVSHLCYIIALYVLFLSLGIFPLYRILLSGYALGMLFVVVSPTPNGVGFVEGSMALAYTSMGVTGAAAATVTLIYRGFSFWIPLMIGFINLQRRHLADMVNND